MTFFSEAAMRLFLNKIKVKHYAIKVEDKPGARDRYEIHVLRKNTAAEKRRAIKAFASALAAGGFHEHTVGGRTPLIVFQNPRPEDQVSGIKRTHNTLEQLLSELGVGAGQYDLFGQLDKPLTQRILLKKRLPKKDEEIVVNAARCLAYASRSVLKLGSHYAIVRRTADGLSISYKRVTRRR